MNILYIYLLLYYWESFLLLNRYNYIDIDYCLFVSIECIDIYSDILYCYNIVTMYYIAITVFEYRYNCSEYDILCSVLCNIVYWIMSSCIWDYICWWIRLCLPKNAIYVIYNVCYISILTYRFFNFWSVDFGLQYVNLLEIQQMQVE